MDIREITPDDSAAVAELAGLRCAVSAADSPWEHPETPYTMAAQMRHGWDGEAPRTFVAHEGDTLVAATAIWFSRVDNLHAVWLWLEVHPEARRRGLGSEMLAAMEAETMAMGRTTSGLNGWDGPVPRAFAARHGYELRSTAIARRQHVDALDLTALEELYDEAAGRASGYELLRVFGRTPPDLVDAVADLSMAINDAPTDDLDIEDEVFDRARVEAYENATLGKGERLYRILARHRGSGELAGHTVVAVEEHRPEIGYQHDTSVVAAHRGHRLGLLLKTAMLRWLAEEEPRLRTIDTWNTESNDHMIIVNERLGYRVMGRELQFQRRLPR